MVPGLQGFQNFTKRQWLTIFVFAVADFCSAICVSLQAPFYPHGKRLLVLITYLYTYLPMQTDSSICKNFRGRKERSNCHGIWPRFWHFRAHRIHRFTHLGQKPLQGRSQESVQHWDFDYRNVLHLVRIAGSHPKWKNFHRPQLRRARR